MPKETIEMCMRSDKKTFQTPLEMMTTTINYELSIHMAAVGDKEFTVRNLIPVFADEEKRCDAKEKIENDLYSIFKKYNA